MNLTFKLDLDSSKVNCIQMSFNSKSEHTDRYTTDRFVLIGWLISVLKAFST